MAHSSKKRERAVRELVRRGKEGARVYLNSRRIGGHYGSPGRLSKKEPLPPSPVPKKPGAQEGVPQELIYAYQDSTYFCPALGTAWRTGGRSCGRTGAILGAWNPRSIPAPPWKNVAKERVLKKCLSGKKPAATVWGGTGGWWEKHFWIEELPLAQAMKISARFRQNAFLYLDGRRVILYVATGNGTYLPVLH